MATKITSTNTDFGSEKESIIIPKGSTGERGTGTSGSIRFNTTTSLLEIFDGSIWGRLQPGPVFSSVSPTNVTMGDGTGNVTIVITGENFDATASANLTKSNGTAVSFSSVVRNSATQLTGIIAKSSLDNADEPYGFKITNGNGASTVSTGQMNIDAQPVFVTSAGSIGSVTDSERATKVLYVEATDPESSGAITYSVTSGSLPAGATLNTSTGAISGFTAVGSNTTSNFDITATDVGTNTTARSFSISVLAPVIASFTSSGTFSVPAGVTAVTVLVVAGGGGGGAGASSGAGAGGLIYRPGFPVTPGGTVTVTVGEGGPAASNHFPGPNIGTNGQDSVFGTLVAKGGGKGAGDTGGGQGGSGGGGGYQGPGQGIQPTQPGDSGTYGFGNPGGAGSGISASIFAGGGGGAGAAAAPVPQPGSTSGQAGQGGIGRAYTIADGTTPVYYAGGGGGGFYRPGGTPGQGGQGGGGSSGPYGGPAQAGQANKGGGGGGGSGGGSNSGLSPGSGGVGGKGIVIVTY